MNLTFTLGAERDTHVGAEAAAQRVLDATHFGRLAQSLLEARAPDRRSAAAHPVLHLAHREPEVRRLCGERRRHPRVLEPEQRARVADRESEEHTSELQSPCNLVCRLLLEKKKKKQNSEFILTQQQRALFRNRSPRLT